MKSFLYIVFKTLFQKSLKCRCVSACFEEATHNLKGSVMNTEANIYNRAEKNEGCVFCTVIDSVHEKAISIKLCGLSILERES